MSTSTSLAALNLSAAQDQAITFEDGVGISGVLDTVNSWNWNGDTPATYGINGHATGSVYKAGPATLGTAGTVTYYFDPGSGWTASEQAAIKAAMQLWADECGVSFVQVSSASAADETFYRYGSTTAGNPAVQGQAETSMPTTLGHTGTTTAGRISTGGYTAIDTSAFGDVNSYTQLAGYGIATIVHELGHVIGLGHAGAYNGNVDAATQQNGVYDTRAYSVMSYIDPDDTTAEYYADYALHAAWGQSGGYARTALTPMMDDVIAAQQIYGVSTSGGLQGGQIFGFNCNITDGTQEFFDFTLNTVPVVNLYDAGTGNTLDLSGYSTASVVNLNGGTFSSCAGLTDNISISVGTRIDSFVGGAGNDTVTLNMDADTIDGGSGVNTVVLAGTAAQYSVAQSADGTVTVNGDGQSATLHNVARLAFSDGTTQATPVARIWAGGTGSYAYSANWQGGTAAGVGALAIFNAGTAFAGGTAAAGRLTVNAGAALAITGQFGLGATGDSTIAGLVTISGGGVLSAANAIALNGSLGLGGSAAGGTIMAGAGGLAISGGSIMASNRADNIIAGGVLTLQGTVLAGAAHVTADVVNGGTMQAASAAGLVLDHDVVVQQGGSIVASGGVVVLAGATISGGSLVATDGAVVSSGATLCGVVESGTISLASGAALAVSGGSLNGALVFQGANSVMVDGASVNATLSGFADGDSFVFASGSGGTLVSSGGVLSVVAHGATLATLAVAGSAAETYTLQNGVLAAHSAVPVSSAAVVSSAAIVSSGGVVSSAAVVVSSGGTVQSGASSVAIAPVVAGSAASVPQIATAAPGANPGGAAAVLSIGVAETSVQVAVANGAVVISQGGGSTSAAIADGVTQLHFTDGVAVLDQTGGASDIARLYQAAFGRQADADGLTYFANQLTAQSIGLSAIAMGFLASAEGNTLATDSTAAFVTQIYQNTTGTGPDAGGLAYWVNAIDGGAISRASAMVSIGESGEAQVATQSAYGSNSAAEIDRLYQAIMNRAPDAGGQVYWAGVLQAGATPQQVAQGLLASSEFAADALGTGQFVSQMYQTALGRAPDAAGAAWFTAQIDSGSMSKADAAITFADSAEARGNSAAATHQGWVWLPS